MSGGGALLLAGLLLAAALSASPGLGSPVKDKRGWTLNSAGYLLGPHAIDNHRSLQEKPVLAGKREVPPADETRPGGFAGSLAENAAMHTIMEFLTFLHLKEAGALEDLPDLPDLPPAISAEDEQQP